MRRLQIRNANSESLRRIHRPNHVLTPPNDGALNLSPDPAKHIFASRPSNKELLSTNTFIVRHPNLAQDAPALVQHCGIMTNRPMESRVGRAKQRYSDDGERLVAGVVPLNSAKTHVLLIQSTRRSGWVMPKGGWETDESCMDAAQREAWEEAGISCKIDYDLGTIEETRTPKQMSKDAPKALYQFFEVTVTTEHEEWPEKHKRNRQWATFKEAESALNGRPELIEALKRSTISR